MLRMPTKEEDNPKFHYESWVASKQKLMKKLKGRRLAKEEVGNQGITLVNVMPAVGDITRHSKQLIFLLTTYIFTCYVHNMLQPQPIPRIDFTDTYYLPMHDRYTGSITGMEFSCNGR